MNFFYKITEIITKKYNEKNIYQNIFFYFSIPENIKNVKKKYYFLEKTDQNIFLKEEMKKEIWDIFSQSQKIYFAFSKLIFHYKWKKSKIQNDTDLCLNMIDIKQKNVICVFTHGSRYLFTVSDLINLFNNGLTYSSFFFSLSLPIKNPYNNIPFTKADLYNIYFSLFFKCIPIPEIIQKFFQVNFDLDSFEKENQIIIREYVIKNYIKNNDNDFLSLKIRYMLQYYNKQHKKKIEIVEDFPKDKLVDIFKPYLHLFYISILSLDNLKKIKSGDLLEKMLFRLRHYFPRFGRKKIQLKKKISENLFANKPIKYEKIQTFNMDCPPFYSNKKNAHFLFSHLGLIRSRNIHELLEDDQYNINCDELEKDRIPMDNKNENSNIIRNEEDSDSTDDESSNDDNHNERNELVNILIY